MREIKFRAWVKEDKTLRFEQDGELGRLDLFFRRLYGTEVEIMQYTGLKDKNGKEIYEGDIVSGYINGNKEVSPYIEKVYFSNGSYMYGNWNWIEFLNRFRYLEITGNIYENPEKAVI